VLPAPEPQPCEASQLLNLLLRCCFAGWGGRVSGGYAGVPFSLTRPVYALDLHPRTRREDEGGRWGEVSGAGEGSGDKLAAMIQRRAGNGRAVRMEIGAVQMGAWGSTDGAWAVQMALGAVQMALGSVSTATGAVQMALGAVQMALGSV
jgi:hypothetical protein